MITTTFLQHEFYARISLIENCGLNVVLAKYLCAYRGTN